MNEGYGAQSMTAPLAPRGDAAARSQRWPPPTPRAGTTPRRSTSRRRARAHDAFADALRAWDVEVLYHDEPLPEHADSVFVFDPVLVTDRGTLLLSMGKELRRGEEEPLAPHAAGLRRADLRAPRGRGSL